MRRSALRTRLLIYATLVVSAMLVWVLWTPGESALRTPGHLRANGLWLAHGWMGDAQWFAARHKDPRDYDAEHLSRMAARMAPLHLAYLYPHLCPADGHGVIPGYDREGLRRLRAAFPGARILPWIGGSTESTVELSDPAWRAGFLASAAALFADDLIDGVHLNIEPIPGDSLDYLELVRQLAALKQGKMLSVAAYPPPTWLHPHPDVHWERTYYQAVAAQADQLVPMLYDTALSNGRLYTWLVSRWTREVIADSAGKQILFGVPAYDDAGVGYHDPLVEDPAHALPGVIAGINAMGGTARYGISVYAEWTLTDEAIRELARFLPP